MTNAVDQLDLLADKLRGSRADLFEALQWIGSNPVDCVVRDLRRTLYRDHRLARCKDCREWHDLDELAMTGDCGLLCLNCLVIARIELGEDDEDDE